MLISNSCTTHLAGLGSLIPWSQPAAGLSWGCWGHGSGGCCSCGRWSDACFVSREHSQAWSHLHMPVKMQKHFWHKAFTLYCSTPRMAELDCCDSTQLEWCKMQHSEAKQSKGRPPSSAWHAQQGVIHSHLPQSGAQTCSPASCGTA